MNKKIVVFIVFVILAVLAGIFMKMPIDNKTPVDNKTQVGGMDIQFRDGISKSEVKSILEDYNMTMNYSLDYDTSYTNEKYYIMVNKDKITNIKSELSENKNWIDVAPAFIKGNYYIITLSEQAINDKNFLKILHKYDLQLKKFVWCEIRFGDGSKNWIPEKDAIIIKNELEKNENIFTVRFGYLYYGV